MSSRNPFVATLEAGAFVSDLIDVIEGGADLTEFLQNAPTAINGISQDFTGTPIFTALSNAIEPPEINGAPIEIDGEPLPAGARVTFGVNPADPNQALIYVTDEASNPLAILDARDGSSAGRIEAANNGSFNFLLDTPDGGQEFAFNFNTETQETSFVPAPSFSFENVFNFDTAIRIGENGEVTPESLQNFLAQFGDEAPTDFESLLQNGDLTIDPDFTAQILDPDAVFGPDLVNRYAPDGTLVAGPPSLFEVTGEALQRAFASLVIDLGGVDAQIALLLADHALGKPVEFAPEIVQEIGGLDQERVNILLRRLAEFGDRIALPTGVTAQVVANLWATSLELGETGASEKILNSIRHFFNSDRNLDLTEFATAHVENLTVDPTFGGDINDIDTRVGDLIIATGDSALLEEFLEKIVEVRSGGESLLDPLIAAIGEAGETLLEGSRPSTRSCRI